MTDATNDRLPLAEEFPAAGEDQWRKLVDRVLDGKPFEQLVSRSYDGLRIAPLYPRAADARAVPGRALAAPWQIMQRIELPEPAAANAQALHDLATGATGLTLVFAEAVGDYGYGLESLEETVARVLDGVHLDAGIALELDLSPVTKNAAQDFASLIRLQRLTPASVNIRFGFDPIGALAKDGWSPMPWADIAPLFSSLIAGLAADGFKGPFAVADIRPVHAAGGSEAQELAFGLATALAYLRALEAGGVSLDAARRMIFFRLAADADQFLTLAKFRALRKLWARAEEACDLTPAPAFVSAETAWRMMTRRDPYVNMLRTTIAAFSAAVGGADAITVLPFTTALGLPDAFARRIARNTQLVLLEESHLAKVADPAAGAGAVEDLTLQLCHSAWELLQEIERTGGVAAALESGLLQGKITEVRVARERAIARRTDVVTGTSAFPDITELPAPVLAAKPVSPSVPPASGHRIEPLPRTRLSEPFEALRDASDRTLSATGSRPKIFLASLGRPSDFVARAAFAKNFFEAGGIETVTPGGGGDVDNLTAAFKTSGAQLACLCSADDVYAEQGADAVKTLAQAGARHIYLAGRPREQENALRESGVQTFIYACCDVLATLRAAYEILQMKA